MAKRPGRIGDVFRGIEMGPREYSAHALHRTFRVVNYFWMGIFKVYALMRPIGSRFMGMSNGALNYSGLFVYFWCSVMIFARCRFSKSREQWHMNA